MNVVVRTKRCIEKDKSIPTIHYSDKNGQLIDLQITIGFRHIMHWQNPSSFSNASQTGFLISSTFSQQKVIPKMENKLGIYSKEAPPKLTAHTERLLLHSDIMSECCKILSESVSVLWFQAPCDIGHEFLKALREALLLVYRLQKHVH